MASTSGRSSLQLGNRGSDACQMPSFSPLLLQNNGGCDSFGTLDGDCTTTIMGTARGSILDHWTEPSEPGGSMAAGITVPGSVSRCWNPGSRNAVCCKPSDFGSIEGTKCSAFPHAQTPIPATEVPQSKERKERRDTITRINVNPVKQRTFPLSACFTQPNTLPMSINSVQIISNALDFLYLGNLSLCQRDSLPSAATLRAAKSIISRNKEARITTQGPFADSFMSCSSSKNDNTGSQVKPFDSDTQEAKGFINNLKQNGLVKGSFKALEAHRLDLPERAPPSDACYWPESLPEPARHVFASSNVSVFISPVIEAIELSTPIHPARVHALPGEYAKVLERLDSSQMLEWSPVQSENKEYTRIADALTMTSFAVLKDENSDRLISWPRMQNILFPEPDSVKLPNPGHFSYLRKDPTTSLSGIYMDVENMFHNIRMPSHLIPLFPFTKIAYGELTGTVQRSIERQLGYRPQQRDEMRPLQCTLPMGFKWAVYISQHFLQKCYSNGMHTFLKSSKVSGLSFSTTNVILLHECQSEIRLTKFCVLILHIIDDLNFVCADWPEQEVVRLQQTIEEVLAANYLPVKRRKSSPVGCVETEAIPFIGWIWYLRRDIIRPRTEKLESTVIAVTEACQRNVSASVVRSMAGRLIWLLLGNRPLLSVLYRTYQFLQEEKKSNRALLSSVKRELLLASKLSFLSQVRIFRAQWLRVIAFDASLSAGAVVYADISEEWISHLTTWSFTLPQTPYDPYFGPSSVFNFINAQKWKTAFVHHWHRPEHINALEAHTGVLALEWATSHRITGKRIVLLSDSLVTIGAFRKGRSSSSRLCLPCRKYAALCAAHDLDVLLVHVPSCINPADGPSRSRPQAAAS